MKERPILMSAPMVRALNDGRKTQTRRIVKLPGGPWFGGETARQLDDGPDLARFWSVTRERFVVVKCPYGTAGDRLWVRETWRTTGDDGRADYLPPHALQPHAVWHEADGQAPADQCVGKRRPGIFLPRWASRILLEVTEIRVERLNVISDTDVVQEGCDSRDAFVNLWDSLNNDKGFAWGTNPWVWVVQFREV